MKQLQYPRVAVIGIGLIGGSFALAGKRAGVLGHVTGVARSRATRDAALATGAADAVTDDPVAACRDADLVYLATPVGAIAEVMASIAASLPAGCTVTDAGSTKTRIVTAAGELLPGHVTFIGGHPMAGSEQSGIRAARADLFQESLYFLIPAPDTEPPVLDKLSRTIEAIGAVPITCDADKHDYMVAATSHLPHLTSAALAAAVAAAIGDDSQASLFAGKGYADTTRLAAGPTEVWRDILVANHDNILRCLDRLIGQLQRYRQALCDVDAQALADLLDEARRAREELTGR